MCRAGEGWLAGAGSLHYFGLVLTLPGGASAGVMGPAQGVKRAQQNFTCSVECPTEMTIDPTSGSYADAFLRMVA